MPDDNAFGTADANEPVTRADFERALRFLNLSDLELRDTVLRLAAQVVALTDELVRPSSDSRCRATRSCIECFRG